MLVFLGTLVLLMVSAVVLIRIPAVQTRVVQFASEKISESLNARVSIGFVDIEFFRTLRLDNVFMEDQHGDTLLFAGSVYASLKQLDIGKKNFRLEIANVESAHVHLYIPKGDSVLNMQFLLDALRSDAPSDSTPVVFALEKINISNSTFRFDNYNKPDTGWGINFSHIHAWDINATAHGFHASDSIAFVVDHLNLKEKSGFVINELQTVGSYSRSHMIFDQLKLVTPTTSLDGHYSMHYGSPSDFSNFVEDVRLKGEFEKSTVDFDDIAYFAPALRGIGRTVVFDGSVSGPVAYLRCKDAQVWYEDETYLSGDFSLRGLPHFESTLIEARVKTLSTSTYAIESVPLPPFTSGRTLSLGNELRRLGNITFTGRYTGFVHDFVAYGAVTTDLGSLTADMNLKNKGEGQPFQYSGKLASTGFRLGELVGAEKYVGELAFRLNINGRNFDWREMETKLEGVVNYIDVLDYRYEKIKVNGSWDKGAFDGLLAVEDKNIDLDFNGKVDLAKEIPVFEFNADISHLDLNELNLIKMDSVGVFSGNVICNFRGKSLNQAEGVVLATDLLYVYDNDSVHLDTFYLSEFAGESGRQITLRTDNLVATLEGQVNTVYLPNSLLHAAARYFPLYIDPAILRPISHPQVFDIRLRLNDHSNVLDYFVPELTLYDELEVMGSYNDLDSTLSVTSSLQKVSYREVVAEDLELEVSGNKDSLTAQVFSGEIRLGNGGVLQNVELEAVGENNMAFTQLSWQNETGSGDKGIVAIDMEAIGKGHMALTVNPSSFQLSNINWVLENPTHIEIDTSRIMLENLLLKSGEGAISAQGVLSRSKNDVFTARLRNVDLSYLNSFLSGQQVAYYGTVNGIAKVKNGLGDLILTADVTIDSLKLDDTPVGDLMLQSDYSEDRQTADLTASLIYKDTKSILVKGTYKPFRKDNNINLHADIESFNVANIEPFIETILSELEGTASGSLDVTGNLKEPLFNGEVILENIGLMVNYLNTHYTLPQATVDINPHFIGLDAARVFDDMKNQSTVTATVLHDNFKDFNYDIFVEASQFQALNTTVAQNETYYGTAFFTGDVGISGHEGQVNIEVTGKTEKGTRFFIPLDQPDDISQADFIRFIDTSSVVVAQADQKSSLQGINLDIQLQATEDAEVQIIFDEKIGDIIKGRGYGTILMDINTRGKFNMYGEYTITRGDYLFTLQNVINKRFSIQPGGNIVWSGSPYAAQVDLTAIYGLRTTPIDLTPADSTNAAYMQRMPVDVYLSMTGELLEPNISFDIDVPGLPESDLINQLLSTNNLSEQEMNEQVFSLLLLNRFTSTDQAASTSGIVGNTGTEALSNQVSNWISQYFEKVDVGVNYRPAESANSGIGQTEVAVSAQVLKDRVLVEGSVQGQGASAAEAENSNIAGEFNIEYKVNEDGSIRARVFNEANNYNAVNLNQGPYTQGVGVFFRREFDTLPEFFRNLFKGRKKRDRQNAGTAE